MANGVIIPDLPEIQAVSGDEWIVLDDGSITQKAVLSDAMRGFVDDTITKILTDTLTVSTAANVGDISLYRGTGTVLEGPVFRTNTAKNCIRVQGRLRVSGWSRQAANPGFSVQTSLRPKQNVGLVSCGTRFDNGAAVAETISGSLSTSGLLYIVTSETLTNLNASAWQFVFNGAVFFFEI